MAAPQTVTIRGTHLEAIPTRRQVRVSSKAPARRSETPGLVETDETVSVAILARIREVERRELKREDAVTVREVNASVLRDQRATEGQPPSQPFPGSQTAACQQEVGDDDGWLEARVLEIIGEEGIETVDATEEELAARTSIVGAAVELVALQTVLPVVVAKARRLGIEARETAVGRDPELPSPIAESAIDQIGRQAILNAKAASPSAPRVEAIEATGVGADPEDAVGILPDRKDEIAAQ